MAHIVYIRSDAPADGPEFEAIEYCDDKVTLTGQEWRWTNGDWVKIPKHRVPRAIDHLRHDSWWVATDAPPREIV